MGYVGPLGKNLNFFVSLGIAEILGFSELKIEILFILKLSYSKPFHNTLNYASTANIEEVIKFYNVGDKTFDTDFSTCTVFTALMKIYSNLKYQYSAYHQ